MVIEASLPYLDLDAVPAAARRIEALGFDGVVTPEINRDPFLPLLLLAEHTSHLGLGGVSRCQQRRAGGARRPMG